MLASQRAVVVALAAMIAAGCSHAPKTKPQAEDPGEYRIGREDVVDVSVWRDPDLSRTVPVRPDGKVSLPLIGELAVAGRTATDLQQEITRRLEPYVQDPKVAVIVREVNSPRIFVIGEVTRPGPYPLRSKLSVLQALSLAGGPTEFAARGSIVVLRQNPSRQRIEVDYDELVNDEGGEVSLRPGDTIYVP